MTRVSREEVTIGIDIGTTAVKAVAADEHGQVVARARIPHQLRVPAPDKLEQDAEQAWRVGPVAALEQLIDTVTERFEPPTEFVVPGQTKVAAWLDLARTVVRRAERRALVAADPPSLVVPYLNR